MRQLTELPQRLPPSGTHAVIPVTQLAVWIKQGKLTLQEAVNYTPSQSLHLLGEKLEEGSAA